MTAQEAVAPSPDVYILLARPIIPANVGTLQGLLTNAIQLGYREVTLSMTSPGGGVAAAFGLYQTLRALPVRLTTHNIGQVGSAANVVFLAGARRSASLEAKFSFHEPAAEIEAGTELTAAELREMASDLASNGVRTNRVLEDRTNMSLTQIRALKRGSRLVDADFALNAGIISEIRDLQIPEGVPVWNV